MGIPCKTTIQIETRLIQLFLKSHFFIYERLINST